MSDVSPEDTSVLAPVFTIKPMFQLVDEAETATFTATIQAVPQPEVNTILLRIFFFLYI